MYTSPTIFLLVLAALILYMHLATSMTVSKNTLVIAGLPVHVYTERHLSAHTEPVAVMFFLHGRTGSAKSIEWIAEDAIRQAGMKRKCGKAAMELIVVTFVSREFGLELREGTDGIVCRTSGTTERDSWTHMRTGRGRRETTIVMRKCYCLWSPFRSPDSRFHHQDRHVCHSK